MAGRSTRNKIRYQSAGAIANLKKAVTHLTQMCALADNRSDWINENAGQIIVALELTIQAVEKLDEQL